MRISLVCLDLWLSPYIGTLLSALPNIPSKGHFKPAQGRSVVKVTPNTRQGLKIKQGPLKCFYPMDDSSFGLFWFFFARFFTILVRTAPPGLGSRVGGWLVLTFADSHFAPRCRL